MMFSDSFGSRTKYAFDIATGNMWALTIFAIAVSIFIIFGVNQISRHFFVSASTYMDQPVGPSKFKQEQAKQDTSSNASTVNESDSSQTAQSSASGLNTDTNVSVNGTNISASTNSTNPSESINKTINTDGGSANVSIQQNSNMSADGQKHSSASVHIDSNSSSSSNTTVQLNQRSSGGSEE
jgi:divalent metal cation (Fe/Co/Zn/Cd) transporter